MRWWWDAWKLPHVWSLCPPLPYLSLKLHYLTSSFTTLHPPLLIHSSAVFPPSLVSIVCFLFCCQINSLLAPLFMSLTQFHRQINVSNKICLFSLARFESGAFRCSLHNYRVCSIIRVYMTSIFMSFGFTFFPSIYNIAPKPWVEWDFLQRTVSNIN